ncbi:ornithine cyclodeaminase family protein [Salinibacterium sp. PAMC 21357]|uniref:ornithine cyclodeaminase family protein n=1 Tax=Salinibacterium sp. PAMC 21357 TaxID=1112215 RepID=UPI000289B646|nr:ornithine cyclodeaminase family protein [Salinibacterium sp. PAMC 21357]
MTLHVRTLSEREALNALNLADAKSALRSAFAGLATGSTVQPAQTVTVFPDDRGDCIFYPGVLHDLDLVGVKLSPYIAQKAAAGDSPVTAYTLLLSASTGEPVLLVDSLALTTARTAATTALAVDHLAAPDARRLALIGSGSVALEHLRHLTADRDWDAITIYSPSLVSAAQDPSAEDSTADTAARLATITAIAPHATVAKSAAEAVAGADVVLLCTSSGQPVIDLADITPGALITSISTNSKNAHEIDPSALAELDVYCDYRATATVTAGEMILAAENGWSADAIVADLSELIGGHSPDTSRTRFFRSTGLGIEDLAIASLLR